MTRVDPISDKFFAPIERAEKISNVIFILIVLLSFAAFWFDENSHKKWNALLQWAFLVAVMVFFFLDHWIRLFLGPQGQDYRAKDFISQVYGAPLGVNQTSGYYNNKQTDPARRIAAQVFENSLFSKEITWAMFKTASWLVIAYVILWIAVLTNRESPLPLIAVCAQAIFSEQILSRYFRLLWINRRFQNIFDEMHRLFLSGAQPAEFNAMALESYTKYEAAKALGGITLSSKIFTRLNPRLTVEWNAICQSLGI